MADPQLAEAMLRSLLESVYGEVRFKNPPAAPYIFAELDYVLFEDDRDLKRYANIECTICADAFKLGDEAKKLPCKHVYHTDCIRRWLKETNTCPLCRYELPTLDIEYEEERLRKERKKNKNGDDSDEDEDYSRYKSAPTYMYM